MPPPASPKCSQARACPRTPRKVLVAAASIHETADPEVIVAEFAYEFVLPDDSTAKVPCVFVMRVRDGQIIESRDYVDPIRTHTARGDLDLLITSLRKGAS
jgi:ketosteroid isomerase-like protein